MASEVDKPPAIGIFKPTGPRKKRKSAWRQERAGMSEAHLSLLRQCPCAACLREPAGTVHHLKSGTGERGMGVRSTDQWGLPMCMGCHDDVERAGTRNERSLYLGWGVDCHELAKALWRATGDLALMRRLVVEHKAEVSE